MTAVKAFVSPLLAWCFELSRQAPFRFKIIGCIVHDSLAPECDELFASLFRILQRAARPLLQFPPMQLGELRRSEVLCRSNMIPTDKSSCP